MCASYGAFDGFSSFFYEYNADCYGESFTERRLSVSLPETRHSTVDKSCRYRSVRAKELTAAIKVDVRNFVPTSMWANAQRDGRPAEYRWRPLFNAAKFG